MHHNLRPYTSHHDTVSNDSSGVVQCHHNKTSTMTLFGVLTLMSEKSPLSVHNYRQELSHLETSAKFSTSPDVIGHLHYVRIVADIYLCFMLESTPYVVFCYIMTWLICIWYTKLHVTENNTSNGKLTSYIYIYIYLIRIFWANPNIFNRDMIPLEIFRARTRLHCRSLDLSRSFAEDDTFKNITRQSLLAG